jgi:cell division protein FtsB
MTGWSLRLRLVGGAVFVALLAFFFAYPTRSLWDQERELSRTRAELTALRAKNEQLVAERQRLQRPAEIERVARHRYNMVRPGERAYSVVPPANP